VDVTNADALILFRLTAEEFAALPATHVHPDDIVDAELRISIQADSGWFKWYENLHLIDQSSMKELKSWLQAVQPIDIVNKCITDAGGEGLELRPAYTVRTMIPLIISALKSRSRPSCCALRKLPSRSGMSLAWRAGLRTSNVLLGILTIHTFNNSHLMLGVWSGFFAHLHFLEAGLATIARKHADPGVVVPLHACVIHGICFHTATECKWKTKCGLHTNKTYFISPHQ
jgi:hypothetical protein